METSNQKSCECEKASCPCAAAKVERCGCGDDCHCGPDCNCPGGCDCAEAR